MKKPFSKPSTLSAWALVALSCTANATQQMPMVGQPVERPEVQTGNETPSLVTPAVVGADSPTSAPASHLPSASVVGPLKTTSTTSSTTSSTSSITGSTPAQAPNASIERLSIQAGQRLSAALAAWLKSQDITLSWEPAGSLPGRVRDVVIDSAWLSSQASLEPTLSEVLAPFGFTAHILRQRQTTDSSNAIILDASPTSVVVRNASNARP